MKDENSHGIARVLCFFKILFQGVWINRFQLFLTMLTMSFGSLGLALTIFLGDGALNVLWSDLEDLLGSWVVAFASPDPEMELMRTRFAHHFTQDDFDYVKSTVTSAQLISPVVFDQMKRVEYMGSGRDMFGDGITPELAKKEIFQPIHGRSFSEEAFAGNAMECMVSEDVAQMFDLDLNKLPSILIENHLFRVVGVTMSPPRGEPFRERITVPYRLARILWLAPGDIGQIVAVWDSVDEMGKVVGQLQNSLDEQRGERTYVLSSTQFQIQSSKKIVKNFIVVGATQSLFCILIATIGVLNVMLTSVARRTREFAIRIAMGAHRKAILAIVITESIFIGLCGALIGLLFALIVAPYIGDLMAAGIEEATTLVPDISIKGIVMPLLICSICSLVAGTIPALKVRKMDILGALREEI